MNIIELNEMIDLINKFFHEYSHKTLTIGGIVGSHPLSHILDIATGIVPFEKILIIDGCMDFTLLSKRYIPNYVPYQSLLMDRYVQSIEDPIPFKVSLWKERIPTVKTIDHQRIRQFEIVLINNAHLIEPDYLNMIIEACRWKCVVIVDPFDIGGEQFLYATTIVDCLEKQSPIVGMARHLYGISTRAIDKNAPGNVSTGRLTRRGIGKSDGRMYISNDLNLVNDVQDQMRKLPFRRGQKVLVTDTRIHNVIDESLHMSRVVTKNMLLNIHRATSSNNPQQLRFYHSKRVFRTYIEYDHIPHFPNEDDYHVQVKPANILSPNDARYHRYGNVIFIPVGEVSKRMMYSIMKNSINLAICNVKGVT